jgi:hypothetical protein
MLGKHTTSFPRKHLDLVLIQFVFLRVGLTTAMSKRKQAEQRKLLENSMAIHTGYPVSERSAAKGATRQQLLHAYMMPSLCY